MLDTMVTSIFLPHPPIIQPRLGSKSRHRGQQAFLYAWLLVVEIWGFMYGCGEGGDCSQLAGQPRNSYSLTLAPPHFILPHPMPWAVASLPSSVWEGEAGPQPSLLLAPGHHPILPSLSYSLVLDVGDSGPALGQRLFRHQGSLSLPPPLVGLWEGRELSSLCVGIFLGHGSPKG